MRVHRQRIVRLAGALALLPLCAQSARTQQLHLASHAASALTPRDSLRILDQAHEAQLRFEVYRVQHLPRTNSAEARTCDANIGRMCYWADADDNDPIPEPGDIARARRRLLTTLNALGEQSRGDPWIAGQRVRYLVEAGDDSAAVVAARECWASRWWCGALLGYALHANGRYDEAEAAYDSALAVAPPDVRCRWNDLSMLLDDDARERYRAMPCDARHDVEQRYWALAQPSYVVHGNDRRTEHFSRVLTVELLSSSRNGYGLSWGDDLAEMTIRYGAPIWYARDWTEHFGDPPAVVGHDRQPSYHFAPAFDGGDSVHWELRAQHARERYSPPYIDSLVDLDAQFAMFRRGDSALVVAVYADSGHGGAMLGVSADAPTARIGDSSSVIRVRRAMAAWKGLVAGVERYDAAHHRDARARTWLAPPAHARGAPALSTLILFAADTSTTVETLDDALAHALTAYELKPGARTLGVYWEVYDSRDALDRAKRDDALAPSVPRRDSAAAILRSDSLVPSDSQSGVLPDPARPVPADSVTRDSTVRDSVRGVAERMTRDTSARSDTAAPSDSSARGDATALLTATHGGDVTVTVTPRSGGMLSRLAQALHMSHPTSPLALRWHDAQLGSGTGARSVVLDLSQLPPGTYRVSVAVGRDDQHRSVTWRELRLR